MKKLFLFLILGAPTLLMGQDSLEVLEVEIQDSYKEIKLIPGKVLPTQISNLAFEIPGIVHKINADIGDRFAKGDVLAELDSREVNANLMQAEARFKLSKLALDRFEDLKRDGFISAQEFDRASAEYDVAKSELELPLVAIRLLVVTILLASITYSFTCLSSVSTVNFILGCVPVKVDILVSEKAYNTGYCVPLWKFCVRM